MFDTLKEKLKENRARLVLAGISALALVSQVSAVSMFAGVEDILSEVTLIIPEIVNLVVAAIPIILILAVVGLITGLFTIIVAKIKVR